MRSRPSALRAIRRPFLASLLAASALLVSAAAASAQATTGTTFLTAGAFAAIERPATTEGPGYDPGSLDGTVAGGLLGVGVHLTDHVSARLEGALTDWLTERGPSYGYPIATRPEALSLVPSFEQSRRTQAWFATLGYRVGGGRVRLEPLAGLALVNERVRTSYDVRILAASSMMPPNLASTVPAGVTTSSWLTTAVVGADVRVALTEHAAVVPHVRAYAVQGGLSVRPGVAVRWTF